MARGAGDLTTPVNIYVSRASAAAIDAVEKAGGTVTTRFYSKAAISRVRSGLSDPINSLQSKPLALGEAAAALMSNGQTGLAEDKKYAYRLPDATSRKDIEYYRDPAHRGYLSYMVAEGHGPSLFFKTPGMGRTDRKKITAKGGKTMAKGENRIW